MEKNGTLFLVGTPIGNLGDITYRAVQVLKEVDLIAAEDNRLSKGEQLLKCLKDGKNIALVSDAGMPGISDPGARLIQQAIREDVGLEIIPGPTALISALIISGLPAHRF